METDLAKQSQNLEDSDQKVEDQMMSLKIRPQYDPLMQDFEIEDEGKQAEYEELNDPLDSAQPELNV
jgi:hypothetical protein